MSVCIYWRGGKCTNKKCERKCREGVVLCQINRGSDPERIKGGRKDEEQH